jgi:enoyl-CoA hydratase
MSKLLVERKGHVAVLTINRPEIHNSMDPEVVVRLSDAWKMVRDDKDIRVAVITGAGEKTFTAGGDLGRAIPLLTGARPAEDEWDKKFMENFEDVWQSCLLRKFDVGKPIVAAVNGTAVGGGMEMLQAMDIRVASETAKFGLPEVKRGIVPAGGSMVRLVRQISYAKAMELLLTGEYMSAQEALEVGFVNYVLPQDQVMDKAMELANIIADNGPLAVKAIRDTVRSTFHLSEFEALDIETKNSTAIIMSKDAKEGPRAFKEKRKPNFIGE